MQPIRLFDYQQDILEQIRTAWQTCRSVMVQMPTGTGKTHVLASVTESFLDKGCIWIVAHRRELVAQIEDTLERYGISRRDERVRALSIQWLVRNWTKMPQAPQLIVIDEAHHALAESYSQLWRRFPQAKKLGMTATPCRMNRKGFTGLFDKLVTSWSILDFIRKGRLAPYDYISITNGSREQRLIDSLQKRGADGDFQPKELGEVFNRRANIERLYDSLVEYAKGRQGIVYAIDISHARNIAEYYASKGLRTAAIDSRTPAARRKELVGEFKSGMLDVLVNVDVFSEGFDCPGVEFVQMARPTLSLAKYLQQVGRGLRVSEGKEKCMLIDNVGLYRIFGLPTDVRNWENMFLGLQAGKGAVCPRHPADRGLSVPDIREVWDGLERTAPSGEMVVVMEHDRLLEPSHDDDRNRQLEGFRRTERGLWGLRYGDKVVCDCSLKRIVEIKNGYAVVRYPDNRFGILDKNGREYSLPAHTARVAIDGMHMAGISLKGGEKVFLDLRNGVSYRDRPRPVPRFENVEVLFLSGLYYSRTRRLYNIRAKSCRAFDRGFYVMIADEPYYVCLLPHDYDTFYYYRKELEDGSIIIKDARDEIYYHVDPDKGKSRLAGDYASAIRILEERIKNETSEAVNGHTRPGASALVRPFKTGTKWGLKREGKVVCPPQFKAVLPPVGEYCAFENNRLRWGILGIDGQIKVEAIYSAVEIHADGTAEVTLMPGVVKTVEIATLIPPDLFPSGRKNHP